MQILSGQYKGFKLCSFPKTLNIRPMTQRVKKSVFDTLAPDFKKKPSVLDLFSGTGNLSFESLSRGASLVHAVEKNPLSCRMILKNAQKLKIKESFTLSRRDVFSFLKRYEGLVFHIIFIDPPFARHWSDRIIKHLNTSPVCDKKSLAVLEAEAAEVFPESLVSMVQKKQFGDKTVYFFHPKKSG